MTTSVNHRSFFVEVKPAVLGFRVVYLMSFAEVLHIGRAIFDAAKHEMVARFENAQVDLIS